MADPNDKFVRDNGRDEHNLVGRTCSRVKKVFGIGMIGYIRCLFS